MAIRRHRWLTGRGALQNARLQAGVLALTGCALVCLGVSKGGLKQSGEGERGVREVLDRQVAAWNRHDLEGFMEGYWRSPELTFFSNTTVTSGWQPTFDRYRKRYQSEGAEMGKLDFLDLKIEMLGGRAAFVRGRYSLKMSGGESSGLFTLTFKKFGGGWMIIHDHTSS